MNDFYVYMYLRTNNSERGMAGTPYYVGKGRGNRAYSKNRKITRRPIDPSKIVFVATGLTELDAFQEETRLIKQYGRIDLGTGCLRNKTDGGEGQHGVPHPKSEAWKQWMREHPNKSWFKPGGTHPSWLKGRKLTEDHKLKVSIGLRGRVVSQDTRAKLSAASKGRLVSKETRDKISASHKGRLWSEKRRNAVKKVTHCPHGHKFTSENTRLKARRYENGNIYPSRVCKQCDLAYRERARDRNNPLVRDGVS